MGAAEDVLAEEPATPRPELPAETVAKLEAVVSAMEASPVMQAGELPESAGGIQATADGVAVRPKWETLFGLLRMAANGEIGVETMEEIIDGLEVAEGFADRDRQFAAMLEGAPLRIEDDAVYKAGYDAGVKDGRHRQLVELASRAREMEQKELLGR